MTQAQTALFYDGEAVKAVRIDDLPASAWRWHTPFNNEEEQQLEDYWRAVPWLNRGVGLRAQAVASLPFALYQGEDKYDESARWENKVEFLPNPGNLLYLIESALTLLARAYLFKEQNRVKVLDVRYLLPQSLEPVFNDNTGELEGFERRAVKGTVKLEPEQVCYFWLPDPFVELGPATSSPAEAALAAAGVLFNVDKFATAFFKRGAIRATMLTVKGNPPEGVLKQLADWWKRVFGGGIDTAWGTSVFQADGVEPVQVGEGVSELSDSELTKEKREDISTALGIPTTILWSTEASGFGGAGVAVQDDLHFYKKTVIPEAEFIASVLNDQLFEPMGLQWKFLPETLDVFQADEERRSGAFKNYVDAGLAQSIAAEMLGLELPEGVEYADLDEEEEEPEQAPPVQPEEEAEVEAPEEMSEEAKADLRRWRTVAMKCVRAGKSPGEREFKSEAIPVEVMAQVRAMLDDAQDDEEVKAAFAAPFLESIVYP